MSKFTIKVPIPKKRNALAQHCWENTRSISFKDRKKDIKKGYRKHK